jgi:hypothetical protein
MRAFGSNANTALGSPPRTAAQAVIVMIVKRRPQSLRNRINRSMDGIFQVVWSERCSFVWSVLAQRI